MGEHSGTARTKKKASPPKRPGQPGATDGADELSQYRAFIALSSEGIWRVAAEQPIPLSLDPDAQIDLMYKVAYLAEANDAMAAMYGLTSGSQLAGARLGDLLVRDDPNNTAYLKAFIAAGYRLSGVESHEKDKDGNDKYFRNSLVGIIKDGAIIGAWGTQQDITEQHVAQTALRDSERRLALALQASKMGIWEWDIVTGKLLWSTELKKLYGLSPDETITYDKYLSLVHPDDRETSRTTIQQAMRTGRQYRIEHRVIWPDGSLHWMLGQGKAIIENGKAVRMLGTSMNIDDVKQTQELRAVNEALEVQRAELVALNNSKDEFISLASHQLRTPATGVKQYIGMLIEGYAGELSEKQREFLAIAYESNERQLRIIDDLLKVAHIDAGKVMLTKEPVDLLALVQDVIAEQASSFERRGQRVVALQAADTVTADVDRARIRMVIENLIDNASKYSPADREITLQVIDGPGTAEIHITDHGVGIAKKDLPKLFQKFSRVDNELSTLVGGTGLGLYWAKKIVDLHGGDIRITSRPRRGSTFVIILPKGKERHGDHPHR